MKLRYEANDGYISGDRPLHVKVEDKELKECDTLDEAVQLAERAIEDDFLEKVSASYDYEKLRKDIAVLRGEQA